jgi:hypothetical protein
MHHLIYLIGNDVLPEDWAPRQLAPFLVRTFPNARLIPVDPSEDFVPDNESLIIDSVRGIGKVTLFTGLTGFARSPRFSVHDYDLYLHLMLLMKMRKIDNFMILGIPQKAKIGNELEMAIAVIIRRLWTSGI